MEEPKCKTCGEKDGWIWIYDYQFYCNKHAPFGNFKKLIGYIYTFMLPFIWVALQKFRK